MPFAYYKRLSRAQQKIYRDSDKVQRLALGDATTCRPIVQHLALALKQQDRRATEDACCRLLDELAQCFAVPPVSVKVMSVRPSNDYEELHGYYVYEEHAPMPLITVWMRTAQRKQVVAFRTFLRTLLHEFCHHLDYTYLKLADSFHTEGFYQRESSLLRQVLGEV